MSTFIRKISFLLVLFGLFALLAAPSAIAQDDPAPADTTTQPADEAAPGEDGTTPDAPGEGEVEAPAFSNPAQAAKAEALAEAVASASAEENAEAVEAAEANVADAEAAVAEAEAAVAAAEEAGDEEAVAAAEASLTAAEGALAEAQASADAAVAEAASVDVGAISSMRSAGMGWGEIAHELGVHPSTLGLGHKTRTQAEVASKGVGKERASVSAEAKSGKASKSTARDVKTGVSKTPGVSGGKGQNSIGLSRASSKSKSGAKGSASETSSSASGGRGNSSNGGKGGNSGNSGAGGNGKGGGNGGGNGGGKK